MSGELEAIQSSAGAKEVIGGVSMSCFWLGSLLLPTHRARIGARMNLADTPAAIVIAAEVTNTALQPPVADNTDASGTSREAVPLAVYRVPAFAAA